MRMSSMTIRSLGRWTAAIEMLDGKVNSVESLTAAIIRTTRNTDRKVAFTARWRVLSWILSE